MEATSHYPSTPLEHLEYCKSRKKTIQADIADWKRRANDCRKEAAASEDEKEREYLDNEAEYCNRRAGRLERYDLVEVVYKIEYWNDIIKGRI